MAQVIWSAAAGTTSAWKLSSARPDGSARPDLFLDLLHPNAAGRGRRYDPQVPVKLIILLLVTGKANPAETAGLTSGPDSMYKKYPAAMLRSRCISACCRFVYEPCLPNDRRDVMNHESDALGREDGVRNGSSLLYTSISDLFG